MKITIEQVDYNAELHSELIKRLNAEYDLVKSLDNKKILLGQVKVEGDIFGLFIFRIEDMLNGGKELVICHVISNKTSISNFTGLALPFVKQLARQNKIKTIRLHTTEKATEKLAMKNGFVFYETILVSDVD